MKIFYDAEVDALYLEFRPLDPAMAEARPLNSDIIADYDPDGQLAGLEILDARRVLGQAEGRIVFEVTTSLVAAVPAS